MGWWAISLSVNLLQFLYRWEKLGVFSGGPCVFTVITSVCFHLLNISIVPDRITK